MWIAMWIFCTSVCQPLEEVTPKRFETKEECEVYAQQGARELSAMPEAVRVGYKCHKEKDA